MIPAPDPKPAPPKPDAAALIAAMVGFRPYPCKCGGLLAVVPRGLFLGVGRTWGEA